MKFILVYFLLITSTNLFSQVEGNVGAVPENTHNNSALSTIEIFVEYQKDSTNYIIDCTVLDGKDAFEVSVNKYKGLSIEFHRPRGGALLKQDLDATQTGIDIKTVFSGTYYLDVYGLDGEKLKTFRIEKRF